MSPVWLGHPTLAPIRGQRALVTGGAGFIGSHIAQGLLDCGAQVTVLDDLSSGHAHNVPADAAFIEGSILEERSLDRAIEGCTLVYHQAAMVSVPQSVEQPEQCLMVNVLGTQRVLEAARRVGATRVMLAASAAAYGDTPQLPSSETDPTAPCSPYAMSKLAGEQLLRVWNRTHGLETLSLRYFNIFGPRQDPRSPYAAVISAFADRLAAGKSPMIFGDGSQTRDFTHISNVVLANLLAGAAERSWAGEVVNIGTGRSISLLELARTMSTVVGFSGEPVHEPARAGDVAHSRADIAVVRELLGYEPMTDLEEGLRDTLAWHASTT